MDTFEKEPAYNNRARVGARYFDGWNDPARFDVQPGSAPAEALVVQKKLPLQPKIHIGSNSLVRDRCGPNAAACAVGVVPHGDIFISNASETSKITLLLGYGGNMKMVTRDEPLALTFMHEYGHARFGLGESGARDIEAGSRGADLQEKLQNIILKGYGRQEYVCSVIEHFRMRESIYITEGGKERLNPELARFMVGEAGFRRMLVEIGNWSDRETALTAEQRAKVNEIVNKALKTDYASTIESLVRYYFELRDEIQAVQWQPTGNPFLDPIARAILPKGPPFQMAEVETAKFMQLFREYRSGR